MIERTQIFADHWPFIKLAKEFKDNSYLYIVTSESGQTADENEMLTQISEKLKENSKKTSAAQKEVLE